MRGLVAASPGSGRSSPSFHHCCRFVLETVDVGLSRIERLTSGTLAFRAVLDSVGSRYHVWFCIVCTFESAVFSSLDGCALRFITQKHATFKPPRPSHTEAQAKTILQLSTTHSLTCTSQRSSPPFPPPQHAAERRTLQLHRGDELSRTGPCMPIPIPLLQTPFTRRTLHPYILTSLPPPPPSTQERLGTQLGALVVDPLLASAKETDAQRKGVRLSLQCSPAGPSHTSFATTPSLLTPLPLPTLQLINDGRGHQKRLQDAYTALKKAQAQQASAAKEASELVDQTARAKNNFLTKDSTLSKVRL